MLNKWIGIGRLTRDPEMRATQSGVAVCNFTMAVDRERKNADGSRTADFINCIAWRNTAEFVAKHFAKGKMIVVVGSIQQRAYQDREGNNRTAMEIQVSEVSFAGDVKPEQSQEEKQTAYRPGNYTDIEPDDDPDDLPF